MTSYFEFIHVSKKKRNEGRIMWLVEKDQLILFLEPPK